MSKVSNTMSFVYFNTLAIILPSVQIFHFPIDHKARSIKGDGQKFSPTSLYTSRYVICEKLKNLDFSLINPLCVQSIKYNVLCLFPYLSNHLVIGPNFSFSHRSQSQGYKGRVVKNFHSPPFIPLGI